MYRTGPRYQRILRWLLLRLDVLETRLARLPEGSPAHAKTMQAIQEILAVAPSQFPSTCYARPRLEALNAIRIERERGARGLQAHRAALAYCEAMARDLPAGWLKGPEYAEVFAQAADILRAFRRRSKSNR